MVQNLLSIIFDSGAITKCTIHLRTHHFPACFCVPQDKDRGFYIFFQVHVYDHVCASAHLYECADVEAREQP